MTESERLQEINEFATFSSDRCWLKVVKYMEGFVADAYESVVQNESSDPNVVCGFALELKRRRELVSRVKSFVHYFVEEKERLRAEDSELKERTELIQQLEEQP